MSSALGSVAGGSAIVDVRPDVLAEAEHAFGNLFHRLHYCARKLESSGIEDAATLDAAITELEEFLQLLMDYTSPIAVSPRPISAGAVAASLGAALGGTVDLVGGSLSRPCTVDPGRLSDAFRLLASGVGRPENGRPSAQARVEPGERGESWLVFTGICGDAIRIASGRAKVAWAVAQKLVEAHGGTLQTEAGPDGMSWTIRLPLGM